ncbi:membrane protein [Planctobacterium marinum]|uniref:Membrane protein n=2 Tax=Planctobacterium marinum TaxID=1631968 RepID=A0AA48KTB1_9ALTE|nr:membrane protein [Planctobacterium marinum]
MAALFAIAFFGFWAEKQNWGKLVTGTVWAILAAIIASNLNIIPKSADAYSFVFRYLVPALIPLFLINANVKRIIMESGRVGIGFILACIGSAAGAIVGISLLDLGAREADLAGIFTATYTGGSVNYAAVIQSTGFDDANIISAATAVDNLMSALFLAVLAIMPASKWLMSKYAVRNHELEETQPYAQSSQQVTGFSLAAALTFALAVVALSDATVMLLESWLPDYEISRLRYVFITLFSILPATIAPQAMHKLQGGETIGIVLAFVFFAAIAAGADVAKLVSVAPILLAFVVILLLIHAVIVFGLGALISHLSKKLSGKEDNLFRLSLPELIIASNASILGATTAPALAMARGWPALATPGILAGVAGYIVGTPLGLLVASLAG